MHETYEKPYDLRVFAAITGGKEQKKERVYRTTEPLTKKGVAKNNLTKKGVRKSVVTRRGSQRKT